MNAKQTDKYSEQETRRRVEAALRGAFSGPPTPLKDIPKKHGESRSARSKSPRATAKKRRV